VKEGAFTHIQNTKPQTLSFGLNDSPVGLCAWIIERFHAWSDSDGQLQRVFTQDELLTNVMIYWVTQTIGPSMRFYYEKAHRSDVAEPSYVKVPTGFAAFAKDITPAPRQFAERYFNIQRWTEMPHGGHFAALEVPVPLTIQLRDFFRPFRSELA
jgi:pimeloyl-ACP methyl ester carboxylesterase